jgi:hypothetical protein
MNQRSHSLSGVYKQRATTSNCPLTNQPTNQLHGAVLLQMLTVTQPVNKFPAFYGTRRFITVFTTACHWFLSWARYIQSTPSLPISLRSILILSSHLRLGAAQSIQKLLYKLDDLCSIPDKVTDTNCFSSPPGVHQASRPMGTGDFHPGVKRPGREADHSPPLCNTSSLHGVQLSTGTALPTCQELCSLQVFRPKLFMYFSSMPCVLISPPISSSLT